MYFCVLMFGSIHCILYIKSMDAFSCISFVSNSKVNFKDLNIFDDWLLSYF